MIGKLAELYVEIVGKGMENVQAALGGVRKGLNAVMEAAGTVGAKMADAVAGFGKMGTEGEKAGRKSKEGLDGIREKLDGIASRIGASVVVSSC